MSIGWVHWVACPHGHRHSPSTPAHYSVGMFATGVLCPSPRRPQSQGQAGCTTVLVFLHQAHCGRAWTRLATYSLVSFLVLFSCSQSCCLHQTDCLMKPSLHTAAALTGSPRCHQQRGRWEREQWSAELTCGREQGAQELLMAFQWLKLHDGSQVPWRWEGTCHCSSASSICLECLFDSALSFSLCLVRENPWCFKILVNFLTQLFER